MSATKEICEWLNTKVAKENLELSTERDIFKAECDRLGSGYDAAQSELAALRNELGEAKGEYDRSANKVAALREELADCKRSNEILRNQAPSEIYAQRLTAAEQRNADTIAKLELAASMMDDDERGNRFAEICRLAIKSLKPTESGASE